MPIPNWIQEYANNTVKNSIATPSAPIVTVPTFYTVPVQEPTHETPKKEQQQIGLQQIVEAANAGDEKAAEALKEQFLLEQARRIYAENNEPLPENIKPSFNGEIRQGNQKLYKNAYDRWTKETAKGQEFQRFVDKPLTFFVENALATAAGMGTLARLGQGTKYAYNASRVAPLAEDLLSALGTSYFATKGAQGIHDDLWKQRQFNPASTGLDALMLTPVVTAFKPVSQELNRLANSNDMWGRAIRLEPKALRRVWRQASPRRALKDIKDANYYQRAAIDNATWDYDNKARFIDLLQQQITMDALGIPDLSFKPIVRANHFTSGNIFEVGGSKEFEPVVKSLVFKDPITKKVSTIDAPGLQRLGDVQYQIKHIRPTKIGSKFTSGTEWIVTGPNTYTTIGHRRPVNTNFRSKTILQPNQQIREAVGQYRDFINAKAAGKAVVGGSVQSVADGLHVSVPNDLELYTTSDRLNDVIKEFQITITDRSSRRIKGRSPFAINGDIDIHVITDGSIDLPQLRAFKNPFKVARDNKLEALHGITPVKTQQEIAEESERLFQKLLTDRDFLNGFLMKNNMSGLGKRYQARLKFAGRQTEMGLFQPIEKLDATLDNIEAQIPGFVRFEKAYPNFNYNDVEGNLAFLKYFGLPEQFATDPERMRVLYRQFHSQFTPSVRQFSGAGTVDQMQKMGRINRQFNSGDASGAGGNMLLAAPMGGASGSQITAAQYLPTYHPENVRNGSDLVKAIQNTRLFDRPMTPEEIEQVRAIIKSSKKPFDFDFSLPRYRNFSDIMQDIGRQDRYNPEINPDIRKISEAIDVPRMTGVRYNVTGDAEGSTYVGNLSGEPISETFTIAKPFEFGRSFVDELNPERVSTGINEDLTLADIEKIPDIKAIPNIEEQYEKKYIKTLQKYIERWKAISEGDLKKLKKLGFTTTIETVPQAEAEIERLETLRRPGREGWELDRVYYPLEQKVEDTVEKLDNVRRYSIGIGIPTTLVGGLAAIGIYGSMNNWKYRYEIEKMLENSTYGDKYKYLKMLRDAEAKKYRESGWSDDFDRTNLDYYDDRMDEILKKYIRENKEVLKPYIKQIEAKNKEYIKQRRQEAREKKRANKRKAKEEKKEEKEKNKGKITMSFSKIKANPE